MKYLPKSAFTPIQSGFTMVELLVVITIIAIMAAIGTFGYTMVVRVTRDAKRQADLKIIQSALEQYHNDAHNYPPNQITFIAGSQFSDPTGTKIYLNNVPTDPLSTNPNYLYIPLTRSGGFCSATPSSCQSYCLYADLETSSTMSNFCNNTSTYDLEVTPL